MVAAPGPLQCGKCRNSRYFKGLAWCDQDFEFLYNDLVFPVAQELAPVTFWGCGGSVLLVPSYGAGRGAELSGRRTFFEML